MKLPLLECGLLYVTETYIRNRDPEPIIPQNLTFAGKGVEPNFAKLGSELDRLMKAFESDRPKSDVPLAILLHRELLLTRREASEPAFWHYISIAKFPTYVSWRYYDENKQMTSRPRFLGDWVSNAFSRLWWWAELTCDPQAADPYNLTTNAGINLEFVKAVLENLFGGNRGVVSAMADFLFQGSRPTDQMVRDLTAMVNALLVNISVDLLEPSEVHALVAEAATAAALPRTT